MVWSTSNIQSFRCWFTFWATSEEQHWAITHAYSIDHRWVLADPPGPFTLTTETGTSFHLAVKPCSEPDCARCRTGRGGWAFRWVSRHWTPRASLNLALTPAQHAEQAGLPWPIGVLRPPTQAIPRPLAAAALSQVAAPGGVPGSAAQEEVPAAAGS